jgi:hypothetical protein
MQIRKRSLVNLHVHRITDNKKTKLHETGQTTDLGISRSVGQTLKDFSQQFTNV